MSFFEELKRRNVIRVAIAYIVMAWLVMQVADVILNNIDAPGWVFRVILLLLGIGFLIAMFFSWAFEMTPEGLKREHDVDRSQSIAPHTGKKLNNLIVVVMGLALAYFAYDKFVLSESREAANLEVALDQAADQEDAASAASTETDHSIAVLPFVNMSSDEEQEYFSDGLSEELLNLLAKIPELRVIARTSSFAYKGKDVQIADVARELNVAHVLEGSVRKAGNQVRITAQLIRASDSSHLWSETYDRTLDNIFTIQDEIAQAVVDELKLTLFGEAPKARETDPQAFALFLQARHHSNQGTIDQFELAIRLYKQVLDIDPEYADGWADMGRVYANLAFAVEMPKEQGYTPARDALNKAIALDPGNAAAYSRLGWIAFTNNEIHEAAKHMQRALELEPGSKVVLGNSAQFLEILGRFDEAITVYQMAIALDPANPNSYGNVATTYYFQGDFNKSIEASQTALRLSPGYWTAEYYIGINLLAKGEHEAARAAFDRENWEQDKFKGIALASHSLGQSAEFESALDRMKQGFGETWPSEVAAVYAWSGDTDAAFEWLEKAQEVKDNTLVYKVHDPLFANLQEDSRWPAFWEKVGLSPAQLDAIEFKVILPE